VLGRLVATGITYTYWPVLLIAVVIYVVGTKIRTISEEKLLGDAFGKEFYDWKAKVPALIPFVKF